MELKFDSCRWPVRRKHLVAAARAALAALLGGWAVLAAAADPQVAAFNDAPDPVPAGGNVTYSIRVDNNGADASLNTVLTLPVPPGAVFVSAAPAGANCVFTPSQVVCSLGSIASGGADVRNIDIVLRALGPGPASLNLTATVSADNDTNPGNNSQSQTTTVISGADLGLTKTDTPDPVVGGANVTYTLTPSNLGPNDSAGIRIVDNLPPSTTFVSAVGPGWTCSVVGSVVTCLRAGPHPVGTAIPPLTIVATVNASGGTVTNSASVDPFVVNGVPAVEDPVPNNNTASANTTVLPGADVRIDQKSVTSGLPAIAGSNVSFRIQPRNGGPGVALNAVVTDVLPAGWTYVSAAGPNWACSASGQTVTCTRANFPVGAIDDLTIVATAPPNAAIPPTGANFTNTASIASSVADPNSSNNSGSVVVPVLPDGADLRLAKTKTPNPVAQGSPIVSTVTVTNNGPRVATGPLKVVELLPAGETFVAAAGTGWTCVQAGQVVTCTHPNAAGLAVGAALPAITINTIATAAGTLTNTACSGNSVPPGSGGTPSPPLEGDPNPTNDCDSAGSNSTTTQPDLGITKLTSTPSGGDKTVSATEASVTYTLVVTNLNAGADSATGVRIVDTVPAYIAGRTPALGIATSVSGGSTATFACAAVAATVTCTQNGGALGPGQTVTVAITVQRPLREGSFTNTATVSNSVEGDPNGSNNTASDTVTIAPIADVEMTGKSVTPGTVRAGENATYVLSYRNNGPSPAAAVTVTDTIAFPPGDAGGTVISIVSSKTGSSCTIAAGAQLTPASNVFSCTNTVAMANDEVQSITLVLRPNFQAGNAQRVFGNTASISTTTPEDPSGGDGGNNSKTATLTVAAAALDLLVNKTDFVDPIGFTPGATFINYRVRTTNNGPSFGTGVQVNESMQAPAAKRIRYVCDTTTYGGAVCNPTTLCSAAPGVTSAPGGALVFTCNLPAGTATTGAAIGTLAASQSKNVFLRFEALDPPAPTGDVYLNTATVQANEPDTFPGNNSNAEPTTIRQLIDLQTAKTVSSATLTLNQPFTWTVTVTNAGPADSIQTILRDTLPAGVALTGTATYVKTAPAGNGNCVLAGTVVTCTMGALDNAGVATITLPARFTSFPPGGTATNTAMVGTNPADTGAIDTNAPNNTATSVVTLTSSSLAGTVFRDRDGNGSPGGSGETGIAAVALALSGTDAYGNVVTGSATTAADGTYSFTGLPPANASGYTVTQTQPAGYANGPNPAPGTADSLGGTRPIVGAPGFGTVIATIPVGASDTGINYNFPEILRPSVSGTIYRDHNNNGVQGPGEAGIAAATVQLFRTSNNTLVATLTTDANGNYNFPDLDPISYYVLEPQPVGFLDGRITPGLVGGVACVGCSAQAIYNPANEPAAISRINGINLASGDSATLMNFGELVPSTLAGSVFVDLNTNGLRDVGEPAIASVAVTLSGTDDRGNAVSRAVATDASGNYGIASLRPSSGAGYTVTETQPAGFGNGPNPPAGTADSLGGTRPASGAPGFGLVVGAIPVAANQNGVEYRFGEVSVVIGTTTVGGTVFIDTNRDGLIQPTETGRLAGVTIQLIDPATGAVIATTTTDANGNYLFSGVVPGNYRIVQTQPAGYGSSTPNTLNVTVPVGGLTQQNFGETAGAIAGTVFLDANNDGIQQPGEAGIANVTVQLVNPATNATLASLVTDANGAYRFDDLIAANYTVREPTQPPGTINGITSAGSVGGTATGVATLPSAVANITLPVAAIATGYNFAEITPSSLAGAVYNDLNNNGIRDSGEPGFANAALTLTGTNDLGQPVSVTVTTGTDGNYSFATLRPGSYTVTQPAQPPGSTSGITSAGSTGGSVTPPATNPSAISGIGLGSGVASITNNFGEIGLSPDVVGAKQAVGIFATGNDALYRISVGNIGQLPTTGSYTVQDRLPSGIVLAAAPNGAGWSCTGAAGGSDFSCTASTVIAAGSVSPQTIAVPVRVLATATGGATSLVLNNPVIVAGGGENIAFAPTPADSANFATNPGALPVCAALTAPAQNACRTPTTVLQSASVSGTVWYDIGRVTRQLDSGDTRLAGWTVEVVDADAPNAVVVRTIQTGADGNWRAADLLPNRNYLVRFREPNAGIYWGIPVSGNTGTPPVPCVATNPGNAQRSSCVERTDATQLRVVMQPGDNLVQQSLPVDPGGVVYDAVTRQPVPGSIVTLSPVGSCPGYNPATHIANSQLGGFTIAGTAVSMTVGALGAYEFLLTPSAPPSCQFQLAVTPPPSHTFVSQLIPPQAGSLATPPAPGALNVQAQATAPAVGQTTTYYLTLSAGSGTQSVLHNHIPLDPRALTGLVIQKTGSTQIVELGDSMQYTVLVRNTTAIALGAVFIDDALPAGFRFIPGTAAVTRGGVRATIADPTGSPGPNLTFALGALPGSGEIALTYRVRVGVGAAEGNGINTAQAKPTPTTNCVTTPQVCSNQARFQVRVQGGVFTTESCLAGKVFVDCNGNHVQDPEELGIPGVRLWLQDGTFFITDSEGKYSYCGVRPILHVLKVDRSTLPVGSRLTESSNRNVGDPGSLMLDIKKGELHRGDFIEGSCANPVVEQVKARRTQGEVRGPETEGRPAGPLRFRSKPPEAPRGATDSADQRAVQPRPTDDAPPPSLPPLAPPSAEGGAARP